MLPTTLVPLLSLLVFFFFAVAPPPAGANYCVCSTAQSDSVLQKNIDYACGHGADCSPIQPNGACYNPNSIKDHCNYAVNSYYQKKGQTADACNFQGTATVSPNPPPTGTGSGGCVFQSSPSPPGGGTTVPPASPTIGGTPTNNTPSTGGGAMTPPTNPAGGTPTTPNTGGGMPSPSTTGGVFPGTTTNPGGLGLTPTGSPFSSTTDSSSGHVKLLSTVTLVTLSVVVTLVAYDFIHPRI